MWETAAACSMWQIRHANQQAAVESLITARIPHKGTSPPYAEPPEPLQTQASPPFLLLALHPKKKTDGPEAEAVGGEECLGSIG